MHWRRKWHPTPVFLPGESQGWGSLVGCHLWGCTESDTTEVTWQQQHTSLDPLKILHTRCSKIVMRGFSKSLPISISCTSLVHLTLFYKDKWGLIIFNQKSPPENKVSPILCGITFKMIKLDSNIQYYFS